MTDDVLPISALPASAYGRDYHPITPKLLLKFKKIPAATRGTGYHHYR
jgi:hypothetical protein